MLSAQCDELRRLARTLDTRYRYADNIAAALREAADTIWELRCMLVDAEDRIRKSGELCKLCEREAENAKLRELAAGIGHLLFTLDVDYCATCPRDGINHPCPVYTVEGGECLYKTDLRDLGVEVDDGTEQGVC